MQIRRTPILFLVFALLLGGCGAHRSQPEWPTLTISLPINGDSSQIARVNEALNERLEQTLGVHVRILQDLGSDDLQDRLSAGEGIDLAYCSSLSRVQNLQSFGMLMPLDELLQSSGAGIEEAITLDAETFPRIGGALYALPTNMQRLRTNGFEYNRAIAEQYHLDFSGVQTVEDLTEVFAALHAQTGEVSPIAVVPGFIYYDHVDTLSDSCGVLTQESGSTVVDLYDTEQFADFVRLVYQWRSSGYTYPDTGENEYILYYIRSDKVLGCLTSGKPGFEVQERRLSGCDVGFVPLSEPYPSMDMYLRAWYVIPASAEDPARSMELLRLLYTDPELANLLIYGVEGEHYTIRDGLASRIEGCGFTGVNDWSYCNSYIAHVAEGLNPDFWAECRADNAQAQESLSWGFRFDPAPVSEELYRCEQVIDRYVKLLYAGMSDPEALLEQFRAERKAAGIDRVIAEKQRQLDAFIAGD